MSNTLLTPSVITKEALMILHQKANFIGNIHRGYDNRYAQKGAKIGNDLKIRQPNEFSVRSGRTLDTQEVLERSVTLTVDAQRGVDFEFDSEELTMHIDDFKARYLEPAMSVLVAKVESEVLNARYKDVYNFYDGVGASVAMQEIVNAGKILTDNLAPASERYMLHDTQSTVDLVDALKGLFHDSTQVSKQYKEGMLGRIGGFDHFESTLVPSHTTGTATEGDSGWNIDNASGESASDAEIIAGVQTLTVDTGSNSLAVGDIVTIENVYRVHPETKVSTGDLQQFVVVGNGTTGTDLTSGDTSLQVSPPLITSGGRQNVNAAAANNAAINKIGAGASGTWKQNLAFHKNAFAFATADLVMPDGVDFSAREQLDGVSLRIVRDYDITNDSLPCRLDILYGSVTQRPQLAARVGHNS